MRYYSKHAVPASLLMAILAIAIVLISVFTLKKQTIMKFMR